MRRWIKFYSVFVGVIVASVTASYALHPPHEQARSAPIVPGPNSPTMSLEGLNAKVTWDRTVWFQEVKRQQDEAAARAAAAQAAQRRVVGRTSASPAVTITGSCAAMKPAGFPDYIIQRESGGDPNARNPNGGAYGCAQIMPEHYRPGGACNGMDYAACWARLWNNGAGASNWACTRESGCLR